MLTSDAMRCVRMFAIVKYVSRISSTRERSSSSKKRSPPHSASLEGNLRSKYPQQCSDSARDTHVRVLRRYCEWSIAEPRTHCEQTDGAGGLGTVRQYYSTRYRYYTSIDDLLNRRCHAVGANRPDH